MRISYLREREPIDDILANSLSNFWSERFGKSISVRLRQTRVLERVVPGVPHKWVSNTWINAIFPVGVSPAAMEPLLREFSRSMIAWRRPIQKAYVKMAFRRWTAQQLSHSVMELSQPLPGWKDTVVVPGNHKLRILRHDEGCCFGILKHGFSSDRFLNELEARQAAFDAGVWVPEVLETGPGHSWFREKYIAATPLNRLANAQRQHEAALLGMDNLKRLTTATMETQCTGDYVGGRINEIESTIERCPLLDDSLRSGLTECVEQLSDRLSRFSDLQLTTAISHGDFQPANLLVDGDNVWIIDWEYAGRRQAAFDALTFAAGSRVPYGLCERLNVLLESEESEFVEKMIPSNLVWSDRSIRKFAINLFFLEELCFHLQENDNRLFLKLNHGFQQFVHELKGWLQ